MDVEDSGEDDAAILTHHARHGEVGEAEHKTGSSPASGGCGWVPQYEDGAIHDHSMGGARRGTVTHPKPLNPEPYTPKP